MPLVVAMSSSDLGTAITDPLSFFSRILSSQWSDNDDDDYDNDDHLIVEERWEGGQGDELAVAGHRSEKPLVRHQATLFILW